MFPNLATTISNENEKVDTMSLSALMEFLNSTFEKKVIQKRTWVNLKPIWAPKDNWMLIIKAACFWLLPMMGWKGCLKLQHLWLYIRVKFPLNILNYLILFWKFFFYFHSPICVKLAFQHGVQLKQTFLIFLLCVE